MPFGGIKGHLSNKDVWLILVILTLAIGLRILASVLLTSPLESDGLAYWQIANNLYSGQGLVGADGKPTAFLSPGYPIFLWAVFDILRPTLAAVKSANIFLGAASVAFVYLSARHLFKGRLVAPAGALLFATYVVPIVYTTYVAKENLMIFLMCAQMFLVATLRAQGGGRTINAILFGVATGCLAVVGDAGLALVPGFAFYVFCKDEKRMWATVKYFLTAIVAALLIVWPMLEHNHRVFGGYVLNNNDGFNLYIGNNPNATPFFESITETPLASQWKILRGTLGEYGVNQSLRKRALDYIVQNPRETLILSLRKATAFWTPPVHQGREIPSTSEKIARVVWLVQFLIICGFFFVASSSIRSRKDSMVTLWLLVIGYTMVHMIFYVIYRYRLPIFPFLSLGAGFGIQIILELLFPRWMSTGNHPVTAPAARQLGM